MRAGFCAERNVHALAVLLFDLVRSLRSANRPATGRRAFHARGALFHVQFHQAVQTRQDLHVTARLLFGQQLAPPAGRGFHPANRSTWQLRNSCRASRCACLEIFIFFRPDCGRLTQSRRHLQIRLRGQLFLGFLRRAASGLQA